MRSSYSISEYELLKLHEGLLLDEPKDCINEFQSKIKGYSSRICNLDDVIHRLNDELNDPELMEEWLDFINDEIFKWHYLKRRLKYQFTQLDLVLRPLMEDVDLSILTLKSRKDNIQLRDTTSSHGRKDKRNHYIQAWDKVSQAYDIESRSKEHLASYLNIKIEFSGPLISKDIYGWTAFDIAFMNGSMNFLAHAFECLESPICHPAAIAIAFKQQSIDMYLPLFEQHKVKSQSILSHLLHLSCLEGRNELIYKIGHLVSQITGISLITASKLGDEHCVQALLDLGADPLYSDHRNWTALQYAVFYGKQNIINILSPFRKQELRIQGPLSKQITVPDIQSNENHILLYLGSRCHPKLETIELFEKNKKLSDFVLSITDAQKPSTEYIWPLPLPSSTLDSEHIRSFKISYKFGDYSSLTISLIHKNSKKVEAISTIFIEQLGFESLWLDQSKSGGRASINLMKEGVPIAKMTMEYFIVKPFTEPMKTPKTVWDSHSTKLVGHRGLGMNKPFVDGRCKLQLGENTIMSFGAAFKTGVPFVEFDIQLTSDQVPVVYHDWTIEESGFHVPVNVLTLKEFKSLHSNPRPAIGEMYDGAVTRIKGLTFFDDNALMKRTNLNFNQETKWPRKGNGDGVIQSEFTTLKEMFEKLDSNLGFNVEIKYPFEYEAAENSLKVVDLNVYVDKILSVIFKYAKSRKLIISSFHPECVIAARLKQDTYPVFFLTEVDASKSLDPRCNDYAHALELCLTYHLAGIVTDVQPLLHCPYEIIKAFHKNNLAILSYGGENNNKENVKLEIQCGLDAIIADDIKYLIDLFSSKP